jgi:hypothetical protein
MVILKIKNILIKNLKVEDNMKVVINTNEKYAKLTEFTLPFLIKNNKGLDFEYVVVSNSYPEGLKKIKGVSYFSANVPFSDGGNHFSSITSSFLSSIPDNEYIFFLCDDYLFLSPTKITRFNEILNLIKEHGLDMMSFGSQKHMDNFIGDWETLEFDSTKYSLPSGVIKIMDNSYRHLFSVQACLWKVGSLKQILYYNPELSVAHFDNTCVKDKSGNYRGIMEGNLMFWSKINPETDYNFRCATIHRPPLSFNFDERVVGSDYFVMEYAEIVRWGKFVSQKTNSEKILYQILENPEYNHIKHRLTSFYNE